MMFFWSVSCHDGQKYVSDSPLLTLGSFPGNRMGWYGFVVALHDSAFDFALARTKAPILG